MINIKIFKILLFLLVITNLVIVLGIFYLHENKFITQNLTQIIEKEISVDDISDREAEESNLINIPLSLEKSTSNKEIIRIDGTTLNYLRLPSKNYIVFNLDGSVHKQSLESDTDKILSIDIIDLKNKLPTQEAINSIQQEINKILEKEDGFTNIFFGSTFAHNEFYDFLNSIKYKFNKINIILALNLRWGDKVNYSEHEKYKLSKSNKLNLEKFNSIIHEYWIESFDYTTPKSALAGPISTEKLTNLAIRYYLLNNLPYSRTKLWINSIGYMWGYREYEEDHLQNFVLDEMQVKYLKKEEIEKIEENFIKVITDDSIKDKVVEIKNIESLSTKPNILVFPSEEFINKLINLSQIYNLNGVIIF